MKNETGELSPVLFKLAKKARPAQNSRFLPHVKPAQAAWECRGNAAFLIANESRREDEGIYALQLELGHILGAVSRWHPLHRYITDRPEMDHRHGRTGLDHGTGSRHDRRHHSHDPETMGGAHRQRLR